MTDSGTPEAPCESAANKEKLEEKQPVEGAACLASEVTATTAGRTEPVALPTVLPHRLFCLIAVTFALFQILFISLLMGEFWFSLDLTPYGVLAVLLLIPAAHLLLLWQESKPGLKFLWPLWRGKPVLPYMIWLTFDESGITYGLRHVTWQAIGDIRLTIFGNLQVRSRSVCGDAPPEPDVVLKFPFGAGSPENQRIVVEVIKQKKIDVVLNRRLEKRLSSQLQKGLIPAQVAGAVVLFAVLLDVGHSLFWYLEMLKNYHLSAVASREGDRPHAQACLKRAESLRLNPLPLSWVSSKVVSQNSAATIHLARSEALWRLGRHDDAVKAARQCLEHQPKSTRYEIRLARLLLLSGKEADAAAVLDRSIKNHKGTLLPRLYMLRLNQQKDRRMTGELFDGYMEELTEHAFGDEPIWPPGGNRWLHELLYRDDVEYLFKPWFSGDQPPSSQPYNRSNTER